MLSKLSNTDKQVAYLTYINRENNFHHHYYDEEMKQYELLKAGNLAGVEESTRMMTRDFDVHLSEDSVRNVKYLFVACTTLATRFAIEGGLESETAYNISDLYIRKMDLCQSVDEVMNLHHDMFTYFTNQMAKLKKESIYSKPILQCMDFIELHLHLRIKIQELSEYVHLNPNYLSTLFKKETGVTISDYIMQRRIDTAKNMLRYSSYNAAQIGNILAFSSQSHFIRCFKKHTGMTPNEYQKLHFRKSILAANPENHSA